jgi:hypothetical protein
VKAGERERRGGKTEEIFLVKARQQRFVYRDQSPRQNHIHTSGVKKGTPTFSAHFLSVDAKSPVRPAASPTKKDVDLSGEDIAAPQLMNQ